MVGAVAIAALLTAATVTARSDIAASPAAGATPAAPLRCIAAIGSGDSVFTRNFNPYASPLDFTLGAIYEPLVIVTPAGQGREYKWLASNLTWSRDGKTLTITVRPGVRWSDGRSLTAADVHYSLTAGRQHASMDRIGVTRSDTNIASVTLLRGGKVAIRLKRRDSTFVGATLNDQFVVPKHVFSKVDDITKFLNPDPVGSGPFAKVTSFSGQRYVLGRNTRYWQQGRPQAPCLERLAAASNDAALLQLVSGRADWSNNFIPNVQRAYTAKNPKHYHAYYSTQALSIGLFFDTSKYPFNLVAFRKAVSRAIDRKKVSVLGEYGYAPPSDAIGISHLWPGWVDTKAAAEAKRLATYNPAVARAILVGAGFKYQGSELYDPQGNRVKFDIHVIGGWSDWVASLQIISRNLQDIGIDANVKLEPDWGSWAPGAMSTRFPTLLWNYGFGPTPYGYFYSHFSRAAFVPSGENAEGTGNWHHSWDPAADKLLADWRATLDTTKQMRLSAQLQALFLKRFPFVPIFIGPEWSTYSTKYFVGWPTPRNRYARPGFTIFPDNTVVLTRVRPAQR